MGQLSKEPPEIEAVRMQAEQYIAGVVNRSIAYYKRHGRRNNIFYNGAKVIIIMLSLSLPALSAFQKDSSSILLSSAMIIVPIVIAVIAALDGFFHWGDIWRSRVKTELALRRIKREFWADWFEISISPSNDCVKKAFKLYRGMVESVEAVMMSEEELFWGRRIQQLKQEEISNAKQNNLA